MMAIYSALGLFKQPIPLEPTTPDPGRTWITSHLTPFSGRMVTDVCHAIYPKIEKHAWWKLIVMFILGFWWMMLYNLRVRKGVSAHTKS